jgi:hypothetical protein
MPLTVMTLKKVPVSLRGDLTKWMQEIATGVYIGNFNSKVREKLWERVKENVKDGEATMSYAYRNEIGYQFETWKTSQKVIDVDGIPLVYISLQEQEINDSPKFGFSKAAIFHQARKFQGKKPTKQKEIIFIVVDIIWREEKTKIHIQEIEAMIVKWNPGKKDIVCSGKLKEKVVSENKENEVWEKFLRFIKKEPIAIYDDGQLTKYMKQEENGQRGHIISNIYSVGKYVKREKVLMDYSLKNVSKAYGIGEKKKEHIKTKVEILSELATKVNGFMKRLEKEKA